MYGSAHEAIVAQSEKFSWQFARYDCNPNHMKKNLDKVRAEICGFLEPLQEDIRLAAAQLARERALLASGERPRLMARPRGIILPMNKSRTAFTLVP